LITKSDKSFGALAALGLTILLVLQALMNMAVSVNLVPVTGLPLPMVSWGGTSLLFTCVFFGIILSVSKFVEGGGFTGAVATGGGLKSSSDKKDDSRAEGGNSKGQQSGGGNRDRNRGGGSNRDRNRDGGGYRGGGGNRDRNRDGGSGNRDRNKGSNRNK
jgi:hypothetical protein